MNMSWLSWGYPDFAKLQIELTRESLRFLGADVAREAGRARTIPANGSGAEITRHTVLFMRSHGRWLQESVEERGNVDLSAHDHLLRLDWLVGEWVDENDEGVVNTVCRWSEGKNFLVRKFTLRSLGKVGSRGSQRIGWDARRGEFKSWVFDSDGGHSEGIWRQDGKGKWVIDARGIAGRSSCFSAG